MLVATGDVNGTVSLLQVRNGEGGGGEDGIMFTTVVGVLQWRLL